MVRAGKGNWNLHKGCNDCIVFQHSKQYTLWEVDKYKIFKCPKCLSDVPYYKHETNVFRCPKCGDLFQDWQGVTV